MKTKYIVAAIVVVAGGIIVYVLWPNKALAADPITVSGQARKLGLMLGGKTEAQANTLLVTTGKTRF